MMEKMLLFTYLWCWDSHFLSFIWCWWSIFSQRHWFSTKYPAIILLSVGKLGLQQHLSPTNWQKNLFLSGWNHFFPQIIRSNPTKMRKESLFPTNLSTKKPLFTARPAIIRFMNDIIWSNRGRMLGKWAPVHQIYTNWAQIYPHKWVIFELNPHYVPQFRYYPDKIWFYTKYWIKAVLIYLVFLAWRNGWWLKLGSGVVERMCECYRIVLR